MTQQPVVLSATRAGVCTLTLNRPEKLNAANDDLILTLTEKLRQADADAAVRVVVVTAAGRAFCAGQDLGQIGSGNMTEHLQRTYNPLIQTIRSLNKPVITAVNGIAAGAGASLALSGDIRLWAASASLIEVFSNIALVPDSGSSWFLPRLVGYNRAFEMMALAEKVTAQEAERLGLCEHIYPDETFQADVQAYAERLAARPAHALALTKQVLHAALHASLDETLEHEAQLQQLAGTHWEHHEGVRAFKEKRPADFLKNPQQ